MKTEYKSQYVVSPFVKQRPYDIQNNSVVKDEIKKLCGAKYTIEVSFEEDTQTLQFFPHIRGLIAILCVLKRGGTPISFGRSCAVFSRMNKYVERTISTAINGSFLSAANNATKVFEALRISAAEEQKAENLEDINKSMLYQESEPASQKQKDFLLHLLKSTNIVSRNSCSQIESEVEAMTKEQASQKIKFLVASRQIIKITNIK